MGINRSQVLKKALEIDAKRPSALPALEQFLMLPTSMVDQVELVGPRLVGTDGIVMIGDDDHVSLLLAYVYNCRVRVYELDPRIVESINDLARRWQLPVSAFIYDVRDEFPDPGIADFFYVNPPYSKRTEALGIKVWVTRALEACVARASGVIVIPKAGDLDWTHRNLWEVQRFLIDNGCVVTEVAEDRHAYEATNDVALMSTDYFVQRVRPEMSAPVRNIDEQTRIYR